MLDHGDGNIDADGKAWVWVAAGSFFVLVSAATAILFREASGSARIALIVVQVVATVLAFLIPQARQVIASRSGATAEEREIEARVETRVAMNDALDPILRLLGNLALEDDEIARNQMRAQTIPLVLKTAAEFIGPDRSRACWFRLAPGPPTQLIPDDFAGRAGSPSTTFVEGTPAGDAAIGLALRDEDLLCADIVDDPPPGGTRRRSGTTAHSSVSVIAGDTAFGMLTLDAVEADALDADDLGLLRLMAGVLAVAMAVP